MGSNAGLIVVSRDRTSLVAESSQKVFRFYPYSCDDIYLVIVCLHPRPRSGGQLLVLFFVVLVVIGAVLIFCNTSPASIFFSFVVEATAVGAIGAALEMTVEMLLCSIQRLNLPRTIAFQFYLFQSVEYCRSSTNY